MARRAKDTNQKLYRLMVGLPVSWREILDTINTKSHGEALRRLVRYALDNGALDALKTGPVTARVMSPEVQAQNAAIAAMMAADAAKQAAPPSQPQPIYIDDDLTDADVLAMGGTPTRPSLVQQPAAEPPTGGTLAAFADWND